MKEVNMKNAKSRNWTQAEVDAAIKREPALWGELERIEVTSGEFGDVQAGLEECRVATQLHPDEITQLLIAIRLSRTSTAVRPERRDEGLRSPVHALRGNVGLQSAPRTSSHSGALVYCALLVGILFLIAGVGRAGATETIGPASSIPERAAPAVACPSEDFSVFIHGFAGSAAVQRAFTKFPLEYGQVDQDLVGTGKPDFNERTIRSFQEIPLFDKADGKRIFPSAINRKKTRMQIKIEEDGAASVTTAVIYVPDTGFQIYFRFRKIGRCWFLFRIDDKSV
jgi:hypothetical protein